MFFPADLTITLRSIPWFFDLKNPDLERLAGIATLQRYTTGEIVFKEGDKVDNLYIVYDGRVDLSIHIPSHGSQVIFQAEALEVIGWSALTPMVRQRTASACAASPVELVVFEGEKLRELCNAHRDLGYIVMRRVANVVASRLLTTRLQLLDLLSKSTIEIPGDKVILE